MEESATPPDIEIAKHDFIGVYQKLRTALEPIRLHCVSMHSETGESDWVSESTLGPDEHRVVLDALETFAANPERVSDYCGLGNSRSAITLRVENYAGEFLGAVLLVVDTPSAMRFAKDESGLLTPSVQRALHQYAAIRRAHRDALAASPAPEEAVDTTDAAATEATAAVTAVAAVAAAAAAAAVAENPPPAPADAPARVDAVKTRSRRGADGDSELDRLSATLRSNPIELHVQRLVPLRLDTRHRRYEVLLRSKAGLMQNAAPRTMLKTAIANGLGSMIDRRVLTELVSWLARHPTTWRLHGLSFSVNLTRTSLHDRNFIKFVGLCIAKAALPRDTISFEIDIPTVLRARDRMPDVASELNALGCPLILDDFVSHDECFALLRLPGVSMIKLSADVTARSHADRIAKATLAGLVQRARSQHILTVAKRTRSRAEEQWLTDLGFDFVQSHAFSLPVTISSLVKRYGSDAAQS